MIRQGSEKLEIEAGLFFFRYEMVNSLLEELGLRCVMRARFILYRSLDQSKMARIRVNGSLATLGQLNRFR